MAKLMSLPSIIGIVGPIRGGKSFAASYLASHYGYENAPNVRVLRSVLDALGLPSERSLLAAVGNTIFADLGRDIIAKARISQIDCDSNGSNKRIVVEGIRYKEELIQYRQLNDFRLLAVISDDDIRYARAMSGQDMLKDGYLIREKFLELDKNQSELDVPYLISVADFVIENNGSLEGFTTSLVEWIEQFN